MKYQLIKPVNKKYCAIEQVLTNRNIPLEKIDTYLHLTPNCISLPLELGDSVKQGTIELIKTIQANKKALVVVDSDCDGFTSAAILINYLYDIVPNWTVNNVDWFIHGGKQHGLADVVIGNEYSLIICPDSSSNDFDYHTTLRNSGIKVLVLDHHEADHISEDAIIINNQLSNYPNKFLSGAGVVWQFCRYIDMLLHSNYADDYLDLVALGLDGDMMSLTSYETKYLIELGFKNIKNPFMDGMIQGNSFSMKNKVTPMGVAFYVVPYINAIVRSGTQEEKEIVFKSMLNHLAYSEVLSTKRGHALGEKETILNQALRVVTNVKNRQTRAQDAGVKLLENMIKTHNLLNHKVLLFLLESGDIDRNIAGLIANKFMAKYQRPCCILTKVNDNGKISYQGSARGCDIAGVTEFKSICEQTGCIMYAEGHQGAFGLGIYSHTIGYDEEIAGENILTFLEKTDEILKDISDEAVYYVDYIYKNCDVNAENILDIAEFDSLWGKDMNEPYIAVEKLNVSKDMITLMSPNKKPTLKITLPNGTTIIKFNSSEEEYDAFYSEHGVVQVNIIGRCNKNEWNGYVSAQIIMEDYEIIDRISYVF